MLNQTIKCTLHPRFNNLRTGDTLDQFNWFELMPCRADASASRRAQCDALWAEVWVIQGFKSHPDEIHPDNIATVIHVTRTPLEAVRIARQIALETGKGFISGDREFGLFPRRKGVPIPVAEFTEMAEDLTFAIHEDNETNTPLEDQRVDDFENHPLAELREAFVEFSQYSGGDQRDPYQVLEA